MSIRAITAELYRAMKQVERLGLRLAELDPADPKTDQLRDQLRMAEAERDRLKKLLEGAKG